MSNARSLVLAAATSAVASWLFVRWTKTRRSPPGQLPPPVERWENEGGSVVIPATPGSDEKVKVEPTRPI